MYLINTFKICFLYMGGSLTEDELAPYRGYDVFVESGTYEGETTALAARIFSEVYTIEIDSELCATARKRVAGATRKGRVVFILDDTLRALPTILPMLKGKKVVFFLDAHRTGDTHVPLLGELQCIRNYLSYFPSVVFILDDIRLWDKFPDWKGVTVDSVMKMFPKGYTYTIKEDRMYITN